MKMSDERDVRRVRRRCARFAAALTVLVVCGATARPVAAADAPKPYELDPRAFDKNGNGVIDDGAEARALLKHVNDERYRRADKNHDGVIDEAEQRADEESLRRAVELGRTDLLGATSSALVPTGVPIARAETWLHAKRPPEAAKLPKAVGPIRLGPVLIRRKPEDLSMLSKPTDVEDKTIEPALFSYSRDYETRNDVWQASGVVGAVMSVYTNPGTTNAPLQVEELALVPSLLVDKVSNARRDVAKDKDVDSVVARLRVEAALNRDPWFFDGHYLRAGVAYATDTSHEQRVWAAEFEWEPKRASIGLGAGQDFLGLFDWRWRAIGYAAVGRTVDAGGNSKQRDDDDFVRAGPKLELNIWPKGPVLDRVSVTLAYSKLWGISGDPEESESSAARVKFRLDEVGNFYFMVEYRHGDVPLTDKNVDLLSFGLGFKL